jgi:hypothetical protein
MGRPSKFNQSVVDEICTRLANGESLRKICAGEEMPDKATVLRWLGDEERAAFRDQYARARELQADHYAEETVDIADEDPQTILTPGDEDAAAQELRIDGAAVQYQRLRIDARKWYASKLAPKKYGDRVTNEHTGPNGGPIPVVTAQMTPEEAARAYKEVMRGGS